MSSEEFTTPNDDIAEFQEFDQALAKLENGLEQLKHRYTQVRSSYQRQQQLQQQLQKRQQDWERNPSPSLETQLQELATELQNLQVSLESALLSEAEFRRLFRKMTWEWLSSALFKEIFWQVLSFGGLGILIGWWLKS
jgi:chromosome segregation ATPase